MKPLWPRRRTKAEDKAEDQTKETVTRSIALLKAQVVVLDARVQVLEREHGLETGTGIA